MLAKSKVDRLQAKIRRVQDGYETDPPVYMAAEAEARIASYRHMVAAEKAKIICLRQSMDQQLLNKETAQAARQALESIRDTNLENATFAEKQNIISKLGVKVYPSENGKIVRILSKLNPDAEFQVSPQIISIASPKL
jgi:hypothetical protein